MHRRELDTPKQWLHYLKYLREREKEKEREREKEKERERERGEKFQKVHLCSGSLLK